MMLFHKKWRLKKSKRWKDRSIGVKKCWLLRFLYHNLMQEWHPAAKAWNCSQPCILGLEQGNKDQGQGRTNINDARAYKVAQLGVYALCSLCLELKNTKSEDYYVLFTLKLCPECTTVFQGPKEQTVNQSSLKILYHVLNVQFYLFFHSIAF